ncbi:TraR/DksA C4-type zinc finger protein [Candidatus Woesebacteria bacterium]|nr:TraR/DksA C4-type zinc finger protein [Candidatus Woesebacteria bacterium]
MSKGKTKTQKNKKRGKRTSIIQYPSKILSPISSFLKKQLKRLEKTKKNVEKEDPFNDSSRINDNASPDTDAAEQFGHARTKAIREQIDRKMIQTKKALSRIKVGKYGICEDCGEFIDTDRLMISPEATFCAKCKAKREK